MGRREQGIRKLKVDRFDLGYFPNQDFDDVPNGGSSDCRHVFHRRSALRPFPGMDRINSVQAGQLNGQGLHYMDVKSATDRVSVFGNKFYEDVNGTWTDRTGSVVIPSGNQAQFIDHQQGANEYLICFTGGDPFKWTGSGDAAILGGSPPDFTTGAKYHDIIFGAVDEVVYFSGVGDPEEWDTTNWVIPFEKNCNRLIDNGSKLAVMMKDHIGSIQGYGNLDFIVEEKEIKNFGCAGKLSAASCFWGSNDLEVTATLSRNGLWFFDKSFGATKIFGDDWMEDFNLDKLDLTSMAYWEAENLLFVASPFGASSKPNHLTIVNTKTGAYWPGPDIHAKFIKSMASMRDSNNKEFVYYSDENGYVYKFNMATTSYHDGTATEKIDYRWKSKKFDLDDIYSLGELIMLADALGNWGVSVSIQFGLGLGDGDSGTINLNTESDVLGTTFTLGASTLGGAEYVFSELEGVSGFGRWITITLTPQGDEANDLLGSTFVLGESTLGSSNSFRAKMMELHLHYGRRGGSDQ